MEHLTSRKVALIAVFSGLYYVLSYMPGIRAIGATTVTINIEAFMASIFGLVLGPFLGALTAFSGAALAWALPPGSPSPTSAIFLPAPVINAFIVGLIFTKRWKVALFSLFVTIAAFWFLPPSLPWDQYSHIGFWVMWDKILALVLVIPVAFLFVKTEKSSTRLPEETKEKEKKKLDYTVIMSIIASFLISINTLLIILEGNVLKYEAVILDTTFQLRFGVKDVIVTTASFNYIWLLLGIGILICAVLIYLKPEKQVLWNILISVLSCLSVVVGGGFIAGLFIGVFSGVLGILRRMYSPPKIASLQILTYFLLAFIGNEADNALGSDIFAIPFVYNNLFGYSTDAVRGAFMIAPFLYPAIRLIQAIITTLIAVPLLRSLNASGLAIIRRAREG
jgi:hypothetical protein